MPVKNFLIALFAFIALEGCSTPKSTTIPNYTATRVKVNAASSQSASLEARSRTIEIKNTQGEIDRLSAQLQDLNEQVVASRVRLAR